MKSAEKSPFGIILAVLLSIAVIDTSAAQPSTAAWVINSLGETLSRVDLGTGQVQTNAVLLGSAPNDIVIQGNQAYIVNSLSNNVQQVDLDAVQTIGTMEIYLGLNPYFIALDGQTRAFVSNFLTGNVSVLDLEAGTETGILTVGTAPEGVCIAGDRLYVTDVNYNGTFGPGYLYAFSLETLELQANLTVGTNPQVVKWGPDGMLHVVCTGNFDDIPGRVDIVDPQTMSVSESIPIGGSPGSLAFSSTGIAYLGAASWSGEGAVYVYDGITHQILNGAQNPLSVPSAAMGVAVTAEDHILICCFNSDELVELDQNGITVRTFIVGDGPVAVAVQSLPGGVEPDDGLEVSFLQSYNFPQPFNSRTTLVYHLLRPSPVTITLYNSAGGLVEQRFLGVHRGGENRTVIELDSGFGSGCYYYRIDTGNQLLQGTFIYLK